MPRYEEMIARQYEIAKKYYPVKDGDVIPEDVWELLRWTRFDYPELCADDDPGCWYITEYNTNIILKNIIDTKGKSSDKS